MAAPWMKQQETSAAIVEARMRTMTDFFFH
jgi:hypothetical protein